MVITANSSPGGHVPVVVVVVRRPVGLSANKRCEPGCRGGWRVAGAHNTYSALHDAVYSIYCICSIAVLGGSGQHCALARDIYTYLPTYIHTYIRAPQGVPDTSTPQPAGACDVRVLSCEQPRQYIVVVAVVVVFFVFACLAGYVLCSEPLADALVRAGMGWDGMGWAERRHRAHGGGAGRRSKQEGGTAGRFCCAFRPSAPSGSTLKSGGLSLGLFLFFIFIIFWFLVLGLCFLFSIFYFLFFFLLFV